MKENLFSISVGSCLLVAAAVTVMDRAGCIYSRLFIYEK